MKGELILMIIDFHVHEKTYSYDSEMALEDIIDQAKKIGLDAVCITDHDSINIKEKAQKIGKEKNFLVLVGAEILTYEGDILVFGLDTLPKHKMHADELVKLVINSGGICICAHPYRQNGRGMGNYAKFLKSISGIEGLNGNTPYHHNIKACRMARELGVPIIGGSDAHHLHQVGKYATFLPDGIRDENDLIGAVKKGNVEPVFYYKGTYQEYDVFEHIRRMV